MLPAFRNRRSGATMEHAVKKMSVASLQEMYESVEERLEVSLTVQLIGMGQLKDTRVKGSEGLKKVMTLFVADGTMVCSLSLWGKFAADLDPALDAAFSRDGFPVLECHGLMRRIASTEPKMVVVLKNGKNSKINILPNKPAVVVRPSLHLMVTTFAGLGKEGIIANLVGTVVDQGDLRHAASGTPMRTLTLADFTGLGLEIVLHGSKASEEFRLGEKLALFYTKALANLEPTESGSYWVYEDAFVLRLGHSSVPELKGRVEVY